LDRCYTLSLYLPWALTDEQTEFFADLFGEESLSYSSKKDKISWSFLWTFDVEPNPQIIKTVFLNLSQDLKIDTFLFDDFKIEQLEDKDWLAESYRALPPFKVGSFFIYGSHYDGAKPDGFTPLMIEAATAFGSGDHGTTSCCMLAIEHVFKGGFIPKHILDMGCGSGILAAVAAKLWPQIPIDAADNDPECVVVSNRHMTANDIKNVDCYVSEGYHKHSPVWQNAPYDFIIANILAGPLIDMAAAQSNAVAKGGYLILSGTLKEQGPRVFKAYEPFGFKKIKEFDGNEWVTLLLQKQV
jgi:ribosomal protein L11 methyltransferase